MSPRLVIGSRGSRLALWQAEQAKARLIDLNPGLEIQIDVIKTTGDVKPDPLSVIGGKGVFTKELEEALLDKRIDIAVHSLKDLPTILPEQLSISAICEREDPRDALVLRAGSSAGSLRDLRPGSVVGTSSQRRLAQLKALRGDLVVKDLRGNVDTRVRKLDEGQYDALILASAGLIRLGLRDRISAAISANEILPAVGQGAIAIEVRADDLVAVEATSKLNHRETELACRAERAFLRSLGGGCQYPIAAHAVVEGELLKLEGLVAKPNGEEIIRDRLSGALNQAEGIGATLAERLIERGADTLLHGNGMSDPLAGRTVVVTRAASQASEFVAELERYGANVIVCPTIEIAEPESYERLDEAIDHLYGYDWLIFTSANAIEYFLRRLTARGVKVEELDEIKVCAIGQASADRLRDAHVHVDVIPSQSKAEGVFAALSEYAGGAEQLHGLNILLPRAAVGRDYLPKALEDAGARVDVVTAYRTVVPENLDRGRLSAMLAGSADCIAFTSSSTVKNLALLFDTHDLSNVLSGVTIACIGDVTTATATEHGLRVDIQPSTATVGELARAISEYYRKPSTDYTDSA